MRCPTCNEDAVADAIFCHKCGQRLAGDNGPIAADSLRAGNFGWSVDPFSQAAGSRDPRDQPEEELWRGGYSPKAMVGCWVLSATVSLLFLLGGILWVRSFTPWLILILAAIIPWVYCFAVLSYRRMSVRYTLSNQRLVHERGILHRVNDRIELLDIDDITFEQTFWERLVGVGTLRIASHDRTNPELVLTGIENIKRVAEMLDNARLAERRKRGVHIEQI
jgi:uncharacterized membrane protein YdbT with pleckstrin-like domain